MSEPPIPRVAVFSELPTPYRWPVFERLLARPEIRLEVFFCAGSESDREWEFPFDPGPRVRFLPGRTLSYLGRRTIHYHVNHTVFGVLRRGRYDVVVFPGYMMFASHLGALWCRARGVPYVLFSETTHLGRRSRLLRLAKRTVLPVLIGGASAWLATGLRSREYLVSYGAREEDVYRFPNTADTEVLAAEARLHAGEREAVRARLGSAGERVVLFVGRLIGAKRCDLLLEAAARMELPPTLWIAGDGPERERLEALARERLGDRVRFLGNLPSADLPGLYAAADLFCLPSDHEPWGAVVCEAAACGLPLLLSDRVGAGPDLLEPGVNGEVFPASEAGSLALCLESLLSDPDGLRRMGRESQRRASRFGHRECESEFISAIRAAGRRGGRSWAI